MRIIDKEIRSNKKEEGGGGVHYGWPLGMKNQSLISLEA